MAFITLEGLARFWANIKQRLEGAANADLANVSAAAFAQKRREAELDAWMQCIWPNRPTESPTR